jgi:TonB family protein
MISGSSWNATAQDQAKKSKEEIAKMAIEKELTKAGFSKAEIAEMKLRIDGPSTSNVVSGQHIKPQESPVTEPKEKENQDYQKVDIMPEFDGGNIEKFCSWVQSTVKYPQKALENKKMGTVYVSFVVGKTGAVKNVKITKSADPSLDQAVIDVVKTSPLWKPGKDEGQPVDVSFVIPVKFNLN